MTRSAHVLAMGPFSAGLETLLDTPSWSRAALAEGETAFVRLFSVQGAEAVTDLRIAVGLVKLRTFELDGRRLLGDTTYDALVDLTFDHRVPTQDLTSLRRLVREPGWKFYLRLEGSDS